MALTAARTANTTPGPRVWSSVRRYPVHTQVPASTAGAASGNPWSLPRRNLTGRRFFSRKVQNLLFFLEHAGSFSCSGFLRRKVNVRDFRLMVALSSERSVPIRRRSSELADSLLQLVRLLYSRCPQPPTAPPMSELASDRSSLLLDSRHMSKAKGVDPELLSLGLSG